MRFRWKKRKQHPTLNAHAAFSQRALSLEHLAEGEAAVIAAAPLSPHLAALGLRPGKKVVLQAREKFMGPLIIEIEGRHVALGRGLGRKIILDSSEAAKDA